jgi:DNA-directed RNA polymerase subunit M/transcription elongation factor TFIIS
MHFCSECQNMYYIKISAENENLLMYYCRNCGHENSLITKENICVSKNSFKKGEQKFAHLINKYTKFDPTLPRINTIKCPNADCISNGNEKKDDREVIFLRYDDTKMLYVYLCAKCDFVWKTADNN